MSPPSRSRLAHALHVLRGAVCLALLAAGASACRDDGIMVTSLSFEGNEAISDDILASALVTQSSGWLPWSRKSYFDQDVFDVDLDRIRAFYDDHGFPDARVADVDLAFNDERTELGITLVIEEGTPIVVESVTVNGIGMFSPSVVDQLTTFPLVEGEPRDRLKVVQSHERIQSVLRDSGYPHPQVRLDVVEGSTPDRVVVTFTVEPGETANFGEVTIGVLDRVGENAVMRTLAFRPGDLFRESKLRESQRRLNALGLFTFAHLTEHLGDDRPPSPPGRVPIKVTVAEGKPTRLQFGVGYGSEDGPRGSFEYRHNNFLGDARQLTTSGRYSSRRRGGEVGLVEPYLFTRALSLGLQVGSWWRSEPSYTSRAFGGRANLTYGWRQNRGLLVNPIEHTLRLTYVNESLRYAVTPEVLEDLEQFEELVALGFDPITGEGAGRLAALRVDLNRVAIDQPLDPHRGYSLSLDAAHAATWLGGTFDYGEAVAEVRAYLPVRGLVVAGRARTGVIVADDAQDVPFSERYFLGGSTNLRGWGRFQVAPLTAEGLPIGGQAMVDLSAELRVPVAGSVGLVGFVDAGNVWPTRKDIDLSDLRVSVGPGLRYTSPIGVVRADFGYQLTRIPGLVISGEPEPRQWRVHFSIGQAF